MIGRSGHGHEQAVQQLYAGPVVLHEGRQAAPDAEVYAGARVVGVDLVHVVPLAVGDHLQGEFVVVAEKDAPLAVLRDLRGLLHDLHNRVPVLLRDRHVDARHEREVERHVALVAVPEVRQHVLRPLVRLGQEHPVVVALVQLGPHPLQDVVGLGEVLVVGALALYEVGNGVQAQSVHAGVEPELHHVHNGLEDLRVLEVQVRLVGEKTVPVVLLRLFVPGPVGPLRVGEDDAGVLVLVRRVAPDVVVAPGGALRGLAGALEPGVLVRGVVYDQLRYDLEAQVVRLADEGPEVAFGAVVGVDVLVLGDVVAVVPLGRGVEGHHPDGRYAQVPDVLQALGEALEVSDAVVVRVEERLYVQVVDDGVFVPERVFAGGFGHQTPAFLMRKISAMLSFGMSCTQK